MTEIRIGIASRQGTGRNNADGHAVHRVPGTQIVGAAIVDGIGHHPDTPGWAAVAAEVAARVGPRRTATIGVLAAAELNAAPAADSIEPDGVCVLAIAEPGQPTSIAWTGDCRAYGWDGKHLTQRTTDHTVGVYLRQHGFPFDATRPFDDWIRTTLGRCSIATVHACTIDDGLVILASDGIAQIPHADVAALVETLADSPQTLANALVVAAKDDPDGYRDDTTVIVLVVGEEPDHGA
jgi:PPM family protein phosphatase